MSNIIQQLEQEQMTRELPAFGPGDTVVVQVRVKEGSRERLQAYFRPTAKRLPMFKSNAVATCAAPSCTTFAAAKVERRESKKSWQPVQTPKRRQRRSRPPLRQPPTLNRPL